MDLGFVMVRCQRCGVIHSSANGHWRNGLTCDINDCGGDLMRRRDLEEAIVQNCGGKALSVSKPEVAPHLAKNPDVWSLVSGDMMARKLVAGDSLIAAYHAALDQAVFLRQAILERDGK